MYSVEVHFQFKTYVLVEENNQDGGSFGQPRQMYPATCAACNKETEVPFEPKGDRPVYCSDCYRKRKEQQD